MLNAAPSRLLVLFVILGLVPACLAQSQPPGPIAAPPPRRNVEPAPDACVGPWYHTRFDGFKIGMRIPDETECIFPSHENYRRKTSANEYAINPSYSEDATESTLHPATVLRSVSIRVDRRTTFARIVDDLVEIRQMCAGGCRLVGLQPIQFSSGVTFALFPKNPTNEQRAWALRAASSMSRADKPDNPVPVIYFHADPLEKGGGSCQHLDSGSLGQGIMSVEFTVADISFPKYPSPFKGRVFSCSEPRITNLGELNP